ncbi:MAG TPA: HEAT repeat domain-containing protein [Gemmataceae bacterium]
MTKRRIFARNLLLVFSALAGAGLFIPGSPAYLPTVGNHYSNFHFGHSLGYWVRAVDSEDAELRRKAIHALGAIGPDAAEAVPSLARILSNDADTNARMQAALALVKIGPASSAAVPALAGALDEDESPQVRMNAALALSELGTQAHEAVPVLLKALKRGANRAKVATFACTIQDMAVLALGRATAGTSEGVAPLMEVLQSARTYSKRSAAIQALQAVGTPARPAEPLLLALLQEDLSDSLRESVEDCLKTIQRE